MGGRSPRRAYTSPSHCARLPFFYRRCPPSEADLKLQERRHDSSDTRGLGQGARGAALCPAQDWTGISIAPSQVGALLRVGYQSGSPAASSGAGRDLADGEMTWWDEVFTWEGGEGGAVGQGFGAAWQPEVRGSPFFPTSPPPPLPPPKRISSCASF